MEIAENTAPVHRIGLSPVWEKRTHNRKSTFKFSLIFGPMLALNGRKKLKNTARAQKSLLALSLGTPFWAQGRFWSIFWFQPAAENGRKSEKFNVTVLPFFVSKK